MEDTFLFIIEVIGTVAFAISGIRMAAMKSFDWFGAYTVGLATAIGGGTVRDLLLDIPVFWMQTWWYLAVTALSLIVVIVFKKILTKETRTLFIFDSVGLALFVVIGIQKSLDADYPMWVAIIMGVITGAFGGLLRDIFVNNEPLLFRKDIYATACIVGGLVYWLVRELGGSILAQGMACAMTVIAMRVLAVYYGWSLPILNNQIGQNETKNDK